MSATVVHVTQPTIGGAARCVADLAVDQLARGWDVTVVCPPDGTLPGELDAAGVPRVDWPAVRQPGPSTVIELRRLAGALRDHPNGVVHLHASKAGLVGRLLLRGKRPTIFQPHGWAFHAVDGPVAMASTWWCRWGARWADALVCVSEAERRDGVAAGIRARWRVVPLGVDLGRFHPEVPPPGTGVALCVGRLVERKGVGVLLDAWSRLRPEGVSLLVAGDGPDRARLEAAAPASVRFLGERADVDRLMAEADVIVQPSLAEAMSLTVLEAMAAGRSVVATDVGGSREAIGEDAGAVVPPGQPEPLADALAARLESASLAAAEGAAGRRRAEKLFDRRRWLDEMAALTEEVAQRGVQRSSGR